MSNIQNILRSPEPTTIRERIESVGRKNIQMILKATYILGAARVGELCGKLSKGDSSQEGIPNRKPIIWGPKGTDVSLSDYQVKTLDFETAIGVLQKRINPEEAFPKLKVGLFRIKIEKHIFDYKKEAPPSRLVAIPLNPIYEPWGQELYDYFKRAGDDYVFPINRQQVWWHITHVEPVFEGLSYPVEKYYVSGRGKIKKVPVYPHMHKNKRGDLTFKSHGLRHVRTKELFETNQFDGLDFVAYIGWSVRQARNQETAIPAMLPKYATLYENWKRYFPKLLIRREEIHNL